MSNSALFVGGTEGFHTFRIPVLAVAPDGMLLAFAEARRNTSSDTGDIAIVLRRSFDDGNSWAPLQLVVSEDSMTCGNPAPVFDETTGRLWLAFCKNPANGPEPAIFKGEAPRTVWLSFSDDLGASFSTPQEITSSVKQDNWTWYATGPGHGIQLASGRLVLPCNHAVGETLTHDDPVRSHLLLSDDAGKSWRVGAMHSEPKSSECGVAELSPNQVHLDFRHDAGQKQRGAATSDDGGLTFSQTWFIEDQPDPGCRGGIACAGSQSHSADWLFISHPAHQKRRQNLIIRASNDGGHSFSRQLILDEGHAAYSDLIVTPTGKLLCLYETGQKHAYERLELKSIEIATWLS